MTTTGLVHLTHTVEAPYVLIDNSYETASWYRVLVVLPGTYPVTFEVREAGRVERVAYTVNVIVAKTHFENRLLGEVHSQDAEPWTADTKTIGCYPWTVKIEPGAPLHGGFAFSYVAADQPELTDLDAAIATARATYAAHLEENRQNNLRHTRHQTMTTPFVALRHLNWHDRIPGAIVNRVYDKDGMRLTDTGEALKAGGGAVSILWADREDVDVVQIDDLTGASYPDRETADGMIATVEQMRQEAGL